MGLCPKCEITFKPGFKLDFSVNQNSCGWTLILFFQRFLSESLSNVRSFVRFLKYSPEATGLSLEAGSSEHTQRNAVALAPIKHTTQAQRDSQYWQSKA